MDQRNVAVQGSANQSIIVTGDNNSVELIIGNLFRIPLLCYHLRSSVSRRTRQKHNTQKILDVLSPQNMLVSLVGRQQELKELNCWLDDAPDISVYTLTAPAGSGKTRLAIELCALTEKRTESDWRSGFVSSDDLNKLAEAFKFSRYQWHQSLLIVIDYAACHSKALGYWLDALAQLEELPSEIKLRILLLEREASREFGWWQELACSPLNSGQSRADLFYQPLPVRLQGFEQLENRRVLMSAALTAAQHICNDNNSVCVPVAGQDLQFDERLKEAQFANPLALVMAGILSREMSPQAALSLHHLDAAMKLAQREIERFKRLIVDKREPLLLEHMLCFHLLSGGVRVSGMRQTLSGELNAAGFGTPDISQEVQLLEHEFTPLWLGDIANESLRLGTTQPDLIAEAMCLSLLSVTKERQTQAPSILQRALMYGETYAASAIIRLLQDFTYPLVSSAPLEMQREHAAMLVEWLDQVVDNYSENIHMLNIISNAIPPSSIILAEVALKVTSSIHRILKNNLDSSSNWQFLSDLASTLNNHANRLSELGQLESALSAAKESVVIRRQLAEAYKGEFLSELASSLCTLANRLSGIGQSQSALSISEESTEILRQLVAVNPDEHLPNLAVALNNLSVLQKDIGLLEDSFLTAQEAVTYYRQLAKAQPNLFMPNLATILNTYASRLSDLGQRESALSVLKEALSIRRQLADVSPDSFLPDFATSLNNLAIFLSKLGQYQEALSAADESVEIFRLLAIKHPHTFLPDVAMSLNTLAISQYDIGQLEPALSTAKEMVELHRKLAETRPDAFLPSLANSLNTLANILHSLAQFESSLSVGQEALAIRRQLAESLPDVFLPDVATSLNNLACIYDDIGRQDLGLLTAEESVVIRRKLATKHPNVFLPSLAMSLSNLAIKLGEQKQLEPALSVAKEAVDIYRELAVKHPNVFLQNLAAALNNLSNRLSSLEQHDYALLVAQEASAIYRELAKERPEVFLQTLSVSLNNLANQLSEIGKQDLALSAVQEAIQFLMPLFCKSPLIYVNWMEVMIDHYLSICHRCSQEPSQALIEPIIQKLLEIKSGRTQ